MNDNHFKFTPKVVLLPFFLVLFLWIVFWAEHRFNLNLGQYGILPRTFTGLRGIVFSPFLHGSLSHLYNNSIPLLILIAAVAYFYSELTYKILFYGVLFSGIITWIIGRDSYHIGASSLIYVLVSFIFFKGIMTKYYRLVALSLMVIMVYGGLVWYVFPDIEAGISWEGHLGGLITGFVFAIRFKTPDYTKMIRYEWERPEFNADNDKFLQRFDENGNFVNLPPPEIIEEDEITAPIYTYTFVPKEGMK